MLQVQGDALARVAELVDAEALWRADRRATVTAVLRGLVFAMSWELGPRRGLVAGVTHARLAEAAGCSTRTVSRVVAWAVEAGLVVCVESGATAAFLGTERNRAPSYVLTAPQGWQRPDRCEHELERGLVVDEVGAPPASCVEKRSPWRDRGRNTDKRHDQPGPSRGATGVGGRGSWGWQDRAETAPARAAAADALLERLGIAAGSGPGVRVARWKARALLGPWFAAGWSAAELLHAASQPPDDPQRNLGDLARGARDPLAVLAARLRPWTGRRSLLPPGLAVVDGDQRRRRATELAEADAPPPRPHVESSSPAARAAARAHFDHATARHRSSRSGPGRGPGR